MNIPGFDKLQLIGRALMLPVATLPAAAILLRVGAPDLLDIPVVTKAGGALFDNLALLFCVGVAIGFAKNADGSTAMAALVGYLVFQGVLSAMAAEISSKEGYTINYGVLGGIVIGITAALLWEKFHKIKFPPYLAFFGGRRFVPIITALAAMALGVGMAFLYPGFDSGLKAVSEWTADNAVLGGLFYGTVNRLLIPVGLHHLLNNIPWFQLGSFTDPHTGVVAHGDIARFFAGDPTAGPFMTGFFPIMMFALPAGAIAIAHSAKPHQRAAIGGVMVSVALTSFLTGVTEPLEFSFMFVAFPLYAMHAVLTGTSLALANALGIKMGFGFSAGLFDYVLNFGLGTKPLWLIPIGLAYGALYYVLFRVMIKALDLKTPGREDDADEIAEAAAA